MAFDLLTLDELHELLVDAHKSAFPDDDVSPDSDANVQRRVDAGALLLVEHWLQVVTDNLMPDRAGREFLLRHGVLRGVPLKGATTARKANALRVVGTAGAEVAVGDELASKSGLRFRVDEAATIPAAGFIDVDVESIDVGSQTRLEAGEVLQFVSPPPGVEREAELQLDLDEGGEDEESTSAYRTRVLNRMAQPAMGGNANDWRQWVIESAADIATGYAWPNRGGLGSVDVAGLKAGRGSARNLSAAERLALLDYVLTKRPVTATPRVLETIEEVVNVEAHLEPARGKQHAKDWEDATPPEIASWDPTTRMLVFTADRHASMGSGHRLVIEGTDGTELTIESLSGTDAIVLEDAEGLTPIAGQLVYSGGPLVTPVRSAILALFDSLGPRNGKHGTGEWVSTLLLSHLIGAAQSVAGLHNATFPVPAADVEPTANPYPNDHLVSYLVPGNVFVRYL